MENNLRLEIRKRLRVGRTPNNINRFCRAVVLTTLICIMTLPSLADEETSEEVVDRIVAIVNNDVVLLSEINRALAPYAMTIKERGVSELTEKKMLLEARAEILGNLIDEKLILQEAAEMRIEVDESDINAAMETMKQSMPYSDERFQSFLSETGFTMAEYREQIGNQIVKSRVISQAVKSKTVVTQEETEEYFQNHQEEFASGTRYHLKNIIMQTPAMNPEGKEAVRRKMEEIHQQIKDGAAFESMARQYSQSSFADDGGDLGLFAEDDLAPALKDAIMNTKAGDISQVIETGPGFQIFYVQSIIRDDGNLDNEAYDQIHEKLYDKKLDEKFKAWTNQLRELAHIKKIS